MRSNYMDQKIVNTFAKLTSVYGYKGTTTKKIATEAGINESTIFRHFADKKSILNALIDQCENEINEYEVNFELSGDPQKDIQNAVNLSQHFLEKHRSIFFISLHENQDYPELLNASQNIIIMEKYLYRKLFQEMIKANEIPADTNVNLEVSNLLLMNLGQVVFKFAYSKLPQNISDQDYLDNNIAKFAEHLK
ncbi:TetR/AcrR family transcriptional regulator [Lactobacillus sp. ESL0681]|uniref:TetR/AcrR family transcriptional regulator n=1 Tax=Lactobacillus sp. ESL0681 TaxID=2983211 RepID=UPI0023F9EAB6|nr:TetR/AcrR family transcriptional regulator [Lactobacillus sp. ESL0681]WEV40486.1 TetR/AcrR family transcriptional regulator [Lactobacillus sp. ESL0681]